MSSTPCECPICFKNFPPSVLAQHASQCQGRASPEVKTPTLFSATDNRKRVSSPPTPTTPEPKKPRQSLSNAPLAERMRPTSLDQYLGQDVTNDRMWRNLIEQNCVPNMILWGPPGCGKTSLANVIAHKAKAKGSNLRFVKLSACTSNVAEVKDAIKAAQNEIRMFKRKTLLFMDEVHRFNKMQQDTFLPHIENGTITLIGATTENPSFSLNSALLSRCKVVVLKKLDVDVIMKLLTKAVEAEDIKIDEEALDFLSGIADGDARTALNSLQIANDAKNDDSSITLSDIKSSLRRSHLLYDRKGDEHYHCASALQKSIRGSDANAALYWCMRMLQGGEDPMFIARRLVRIASEDVGLADNQALPLAVSAMQACQLIGKPECNTALAQCAVYLARANKSHEIVSAVDKVMKTLEQGNLPPVPLHLRNASSKLGRDLGYGQGYSFDLAKVKDINYMPEELKNHRFI